MLVFAFANFHQIAASPPPTTTSCYADQPDKYFLFSTKTGGFEITQRNTTPLFVPGWFYLRCYDMRDELPTNLPARLHYFREVEWF